MDLNTLETYLNTPLQSLMDRSSTLSSEAIEQSNAALKPYLKRMAHFKATLTAQLKDLLESKAYLALGTSSTDFGIYFVEFI